MHGGGVFLFRLRLPKRGEKNQINCRFYAQQQQTLTDCMRRRSFFCLLNRPFFFISFFVCSFVRSFVRLIACGGQVGSFKETTCDARTKARIEHEATAANMQRTNPSFLPSFPFLALI
jgi:hypothetical protein